jgi:hypothetical protein
MPEGYRIFILATSIVAAVTYGVFQFPPLTSGGNASSTDLSQASFDAIISEELEHCRANPGAINCRCFANISGNIMGHAEPRVAGAVYADKRELARGQAGDSC